MTSYFRDARADDMRVGRRVFSAYLAPGLDATPANVGTITRLHEDGWHEVTTDDGHRHRFDVTRLGVFRTEFDEMTSYHKAALAHLQTVTPRPLHEMTRADAEPFHAERYAPAEAAELWAAHELYRAELAELYGDERDNAPTYDSVTGAGSEIRMTAAELWTEAALDAEAAYYADPYEEAWR